MQNAERAVAMRLSAFCLLPSAFLPFFLGCATGPKTTAPDLKSVPAMAIEAACTKLRNEGMTSDATMVVKTTQPIITGASLRSLAHSYNRDVDAGALAVAINSAVTST